MKLMWIGSMKFMRLIECNEINWINERLDELDGLLKRDIITVTLRIQNDIKAVGCKKPNFIPDKYVILEFIFSYRGKLINLISFIFWFHLKLIQFNIFYKYHTCNIKFSHFIIKKPKYESTFNIISFIIDSLLNPIIDSSN